MMAGWMYVATEVFSVTVCQRQSALSEAVVFKKSARISGEVVCLDVAVWTILIYVRVMTMLASPLYIHHLVTNGSA